MAIWLIFLPAFSCAAMSSIFAPPLTASRATKIAPVPGAEPGTYKFKATFGMAGRWQLSLGAKVQGETGTVENKLTIQANK